MFGSGNMGQNNWERCPFQMDWTPALVKSEIRACCCYASCVLSQLNPERTLPSFHSNRLHGCTTTIELWKKIQWNRCHQMASLAFRFYQIQFRPGLRPGPSRGSLRRSPRPSSRMGRGTPPPHPSPLRHLRRHAHRASPVFKTLRRPW